MKNADIPIDLSRALYQKGPKFRSHVIIFLDNKAYLKPTISSVLFCVVYIVVAFFLLVLAGFVYFKNNQIDFAIFLLAFGIAIGTFGVTLLKPFIKQVYFDNELGKFRNNIDRTVKIDNIVSLQILNKIIRSKHGLSYPCYELNLVTKYGRRVNVLNHNDIDQLEIDAKKLSEFLSVELQDLRREIIL